VSAEESKIYRIDSVNSNGLDVPFQETLSLTGYPNPFTETITIGYQINQPSEVFISITDYTGKLIRVLVNQHRNSGSYQVFWNGNSDQNIEVPGGIYFCSLKTEYYYNAIKIVKSH